MDKFILQSKSKTKTTDPHEKDVVQLVIQEKNTNTNLDETWKHELERHSEQDDTIQSYLQTHNEKEQIAYFIAKKHLKSSFDIRKSNGYIEYLRVNKIK